MSIRAIARTRAPVRTMPIALRAASTAPARSAGPTKPAASSAPAAPAAAPAPSERPLYASQASLPRLPVPPLDQTLSRYVDTLRPLLSAAQLAASQAAVDAFRAGPAPELQRRLEARARERTSWLSEWWNEAAYMGYRGRLVPNVSYFYVHRKDTAQGKSQARRAAELVCAAVEFKKLVDSERLVPEKVRGQPLCMASYKYLFNAARIPTRPSDVPRAFDKTTNHVVALCRDRLWVVDAGGNAGDLERAFDEVKARSETDGDGVGILTSEDRDVWADAHQRLVDLGNGAALEKVASAVVVVCLDDDAPATDDARAWAYWAGGRGQADRGRNRWFDKHQLIVGADGVSGFNGEHSMLDGTPTLRLNEFMLASLAAGKIPLDGASVPGRPTELTFSLDDGLRAQIAASKAGFASDMAKQEVRMVTFTGYGKGAVKTHRVSPDAWVQMCKQLAFTRLHGRPAVTYESCQTRKFALGRTEVIRAASAESRAFAEAMLDPAAADGARADRFRAACKRHTEYSTWAADAQGVDRHLFGLRKLVREGEPVPDIFTDEAYAKSGHWELSTSQLSSDWLEGWGYGEVVADGYGLSYSIHDDKIRWGITTSRGAGEAEKLGRALCAAAEEVRAMMDRAAAAA